MGRPRTNSKAPKKALPVRVDPELFEWLELVRKREGWSLTEVVEWALGGVRYLEVKLGDRLGPLQHEQRQGGDTVFVAFYRRLEESYGRDALPNIRDVNPHRKTPVRR